MPDDRERRSLELLSVGGVVAILVGIRMLDGTDLASSWEGGLSGVVSQLPVTLPAAVLVLAAAVLQLAAGAVAVRFLRATPYPSVTDAVLGGMVGAVAIGLVALMLLGTLGWFRLPVLLAINAMVMGAGWFARPILAARPSVTLGWPAAGLAFVVFAWSGSVILQLASPVVPFIDVLPNHVAPAEHLRAFGAFDVLTTAPSPIYGPSRMFLGFTALLGSATVLSGQPAALAVSAFILPATILVGLGMGRMATAIHGAGVGWWMLIAFTLSISFARMADDRATVLVLPLVAFCFVELLGEEPDRRRPYLLGLGLGMAIYLHPLVGVLTAATIAALVAVFPDRHARVAVPALLMAAVLVVPQALTMVGVDLPSVLGLLAVPPAVAVGWAFDRSETARRWAAVAIRLLTAASAVAVVVLALPSLGQWVSTFVDFFLQYPVLLWTVAVGGIMAWRQTFAPVPVAAFVIGLLAVVAAAAIPWDAVGIEGLSFEVTKTLHYWTPVFLALMGAFALLAVWRHPAFGLPLRTAVVGIFLLAATLPIRSEPIEALLLGEHRMSETLSIDLRAAEYGFWYGYPDSRTVITPVQQELVDRFREQVADGRLHATTPVLHVAYNFQQWDATPIGVFGGMLETDVTVETEVSAHTAGGRLHPWDQLDELLAAGYPYVLLEPGDLPADTRERVVDAGFQSIFANQQGEIFVAEGSE